MTYQQFAFYCNVMKHLVAKKKKTCKKVLTKGGGGSILIELLR